MRNLYAVFFFVVLSITGCISSGGNTGRVQSYVIPSGEPQWVRDGEPIQFENELWYPADGIESLKDSEVYMVGEHKGTQVFVDKVDVRPYSRVYTKFDRNKFRYFKKRISQ